MGSNYSLMMKSVYDYQTVYPQTTITETFLQQAANGNSTVTCPHLHYHSLY